MLTRSQRRTYVAHTKEERGRTVHLQVTGNQGFNLVLPMFHVDKITVEFPDQNISCIIMAREYRFTMSL